MSTICFYAQFIASKVGLNSLTVTWDVEQVTRSDGTRAALVTGGATTITVGRRGLYGYRLASADLSLYDYVATAITATTTVDQQEIAAIGMVIPDALVSGALQPATPGRTLAVDEAGNVVLAAAQGAVTYNGQVKVLADVAGEGAFHVVNSSALGRGLNTFGGNYGMYNSGNNGGMMNSGVYYGTVNNGSSDNVLGVDAAGIRAAIGMALADLDAQLAAILAGAGGDAPTAPEVATAVRTEIAAELAIINALDTSAVTITTSNNAGQLTLYRGVTFTATVSGLTISASWTKMFLTIKSDLDLADAAATVQIVETNPGAVTDGLLYLNAAALVSPIVVGDGALVVNQPAGTVAITLSDNATAQLARARSLHWDLKEVVSTTSTLLATGSADVELTPTRTI